VREALRRIGGVQRGPLGWLLSNAGLVQKILLPVMQRNPAGNAITRDTVAITILRGGIKENIVPGEVEAVINARLLPGSSLDRFVEKLRKRIGDDRVELTVEAWPGRDRPTTFDSATFASIEAVASALFEDPARPLVIIPAISPGTTDSRYYSQAGLECYRFHPLILDASERSGLHGVNERISVENLERGTRFYLNLLQTL
jgi:carboxypeptidase PM20D1